MKIKYLVILTILLLPAVTSLLHLGYFGASDDMHIGWLYEMHRTVMAGKLPPRFVPDLSFGFGYPLFNFVYPLPFYLGELFHLVSFSLVNSTKLVFIVSLIVSGWTMYLFTRQFSSRRSSLLASLVYVYTPYRSTDIYVRGAIGEAFAFIFLPLILLALQKNRSLRWMAIGGLAAAGLVLSHNIAAYMFIPFVVLYAVINKTNLKHLLLLALFSLLLSAYFWLPALKESSLLKYDTVFNYLDHFPTLKQLVVPYWGYGASVPGPYDGMSFYMGTANLIALIIAPFFFFKSRFKRLYVWVYLSLAISVFMMNFRSTLIWEKIPLLPYFQFPWRFLTITTLISSTIVSQINIPRKFLPLFVVPILFIAASVFRPHDFLNRSDGYFLNRYVPFPTASDDYRLTQEEYLRLPKATVHRPADTFPVVSSMYVSNFQAINSLDSAFVTASQAPLILSYNKYNFPGWQVRIDNRQVNIRSGNPYGQVIFTVPAGAHSVYVSYQETGLHLALDMISLTGFILCLGVIAYAKK